MDVSLCIVTRNRPDDLTKCLRSAEESSIPFKEIIVSDDSTDERTRNLVYAQFPNVKYVEGPRKGIGPNRNSALAAATGDWLLFLDDDACVGVDFLKTLEPLIAAHAGERIIYSGTEDSWGKRIIPNDLNFLGFETRPHRPNEPWNMFVINAALFPAALCRTLAFDSRLIYGYDEIDLAIRARAAGWSILFYPEAVNYHYPSKLNRDHYALNAEIARIYVIFKKYYESQGNPLKAMAFLGISFMHSFAHHIKREGFRGIPQSFVPHRKAWAQIGAWLREKKQASHIQSTAAALAGKDK